MRKTKTVYETIEKEEEVVHSDLSGVATDDYVTLYADPEFRRGSRKRVIRTVEEVTLQSQGKIDLTKEEFDELKSQGAGTENFEVVNVNDDIEIPVFFFSCFFLFSGSFLVAAIVAVFSGLAGFGVFCFLAGFSMPYIPELASKL